LLQGLSEWAARPYSAFRCLPRPRYPISLIPAPASYYVSLEIISSMSPGPYATYSASGTVQPIGQDQMPSTVCPGASSLLAGTRCIMPLLIAFNIVSRCSQACLSPSCSSLRLACPYFSPCMFGGGSGLRCDEGRCGVTVVRYGGSWRNPVP
jgi:hypothetical protein